MVIRLSIPILESKSDADWFCFRRSSVCFLTALTMAASLLPYLGVLTRAGSYRGCVDAHDRIPLSMGIAAEGSVPLFAPSDIFP